MKNNNLMGMYEMSIVLIIIKNLDNVIYYHEERSWSRNLFRRF